MIQGGKQVTLSNIKHVFEILNNAILNSELYKYFIPFLCFILNKSLQCTHRSGRQITGDLVRGRVLGVLQQEVPVDGILTLHAQKLVGEDHLRLIEI